MGEDGSTASIFPGQMDDAIHAPGGRRAVGVTPDPMPENAPFARVTPFARVSMTRSALLSAHTIIVTLSGAKRRELLEQAIADGPLSNVPIGRVLAGADVPVDIYWSAA